MGELRELRDRREGSEKKSENVKMLVVSSAVKLKCRNTKDDSGKIIFVKRSYVLKKNRILCGSSCMHCSALRNPICLITKKIKQLYDALTFK